MENKYWVGRSVLVTGANGFAGTNLCYSLLDAGAKVRAFVKRGGQLKGIEPISDKVEIAYGDVNDMHSLLNATKDIDVVFNLAAVVPVMAARQAPYQTINTNIIGPYNVALASSKNKVQKIVHISTCHVYGNQPESKLPLKEDVIPEPNDMYASSKYAAEMVLKQFVADGFPIVITRAFNHYGPWQIGDFIVPKTINKALKNEEVVLGSPKPTRDFSYIKDIVEGYMLAGEFGRSGEIYHLCSGKELTVGQICEAAVAASGKDIKIKWRDERKQDISRSYGDYSKAKKEFGWAPKVGLEEGMKLTVDWCRSVLKPK